MPQTDVRSVLSDVHVEQIRQIADSIKFGTITLVFQDNRLVQIDHSEKIRVDKINSKK